MRTETGTAIVQWLRSKPGVHRVHNLEVEGEHQYFVSKTDVLVHNWCVTTTAEGSFESGDAEMFPQVGGGVSFNGISAPPAYSVGAPTVSGIAARLPLWGVGDPAPRCALLSATHYTS